MKRKRKVRKEYLLLTFFLGLFVILSFNLVSANAVTIRSPVIWNNYSTTMNVSITNDLINSTSVSYNVTLYCNKSGGAVEALAGYKIVTIWNATAINSTFENATVSITGLTDSFLYNCSALADNGTSAGGAPAWSAVSIRNITIDNTAPAVSFSGIDNTINYGNYSGTIVVNVSVIDNGMGVNRVYFNITNSSGTQISWTRAINSGDYYNITLDTTAFVEGFYNITVYANDTELGNSNNTERIQITIDRTVPTISLSKSSSTANSITVSYSCGDATSGIESCTLSSSSGTVSGSTISDLGCGGAYTITVNAEDNTGNTVSSSQSFSTASCGGGVIPSLPKKIQSFTLITPGTVAIVKDFDSRIGIKEIQINVNNKAQNVKITVTKYDSKPTEVSVAKSGTIYQYIQINTQNLNENLEKAVVQFRVEKTWIANNNLQKENVMVYKFDNSENMWNELTTTYKSEDNTYYYYDVELDSFSYFAVGEKTQVVPEEKTTIETLTKNYLLVWIIIVVIVSATIFFLFKIKKKKK